MILRPLERYRAVAAPWVAALSRGGDRHWKWLTFLIWIAIAVGFVWSRWGAVHWLVLGDTDDNIRYVQVKDWLAGQGWFDLSQHRFDPPHGGNIHWSRLVDLPIAGLMLLFGAFVDQGQADRMACAIAPLLPLLLLMLSLGFMVRRLSGAATRRWAWLLAALAPFAAPWTINMFAPMRVDHHGWQLALLATMLAGMIDSNRRRGGVIAGISTALSVAIGMEMIVYLAAGGALVALRWVFREGADRRMLPYALSLGGGISVMFAAFASNANRAYVCDALSPIWLSIFAAASAGMALLCLLPLRNWWQRLGAGLIVGGAVAVFAWLNWPQCLSSAYQIDPELQRLWLANIREAKPIMAQGQGVVVPLLAMPGAALLGLVWALWDRRRDNEGLWAFATVGLMMLLSTAMLFWQIRAAPAAQLLAIPIAAWTAAMLLYLIFAGRGWARWLAIGAAALSTSVASASVAYPWAVKQWGEISGNKPRPWRPSAVARSAAIKQANGRCRTQPALAVLDQLPPATIFTLVDLGPRIIATTHHSVLGGPYHRNGATILDIHRAFDGPTDRFRTIAAKHRATYLLVCPNFPEGTIYSTRSRRGFYADLMRGTLPGWLKPVTLRTGLTLPYTLYRIDYSAPGGKEAAQQR
ncbi:MAG: hypothetical protein ABW039_08710 [Sphingobium sp.]